MGNILSRCADEISHVFRNCRSQKSEEEKKRKRDLEVQNRHDRHGQSLDRAEQGLLLCADSPAADSRRGLLGSYSSRIEEDWLPECDQTHSNRQCPRSASADSFLLKSRDFPCDPIISKEYIIQTYKITNPEEHVAAFVGSRSVPGDARYGGGDSQDQGCVPEKSGEKQVENFDAPARDSSGQQNMENMAFTTVPVIRPHCSEFKPKRAESFTAPRRTVEEIATESFLSHLKWKKEMDAIDSCMQSKLTECVSKRAKIQPIVKLQPKSFTMDSRMQRKDTQQAQTDRLKEHGSTHRHMQEPFCKTTETVPIGLGENVVKTEVMVETEQKQKCDLLMREGDVRLHCYQQTNPEKECIIATKSFHCASKPKMEVSNITEQSLGQQKVLGRGTNVPQQHGEISTAKEETVTATCYDPHCKLAKQADTTKNREQGTENSAERDGEEKRMTDGSSARGSDNASSSGTGTKKSGGEEQVPERVRKLEQRQERVLQELQKLQQSVQKLAQQRGVSLAAAASPGVGASATSGSSEQSPLQNGKLHDLVISADPSSVPLSLLVLLKQLSKQCNVLTSTFVHSSATDTPEKLRAFLQNGPQAGARSSYQLAITVVWKKISNGPRMMVSPTRQTYIEGESNIARYLARLLQPAYDSGDVILATQVDELLDLSQQQILGGNNKERSAALRTLNARLGKGQWLVGGSLSVADVVAWSAVQGARLAGDAPANVKKWLKACAENELFQEAVKFLPSS